MTKEQFSSLSMQKACLGAYQSLKKGQITKEKFNEYLRYWWQVNRHQTDLLKDIEEVFGA